MFFREPTKKRVIRDFFSERDEPSKKLKKDHIDINKIEAKPYRFVKLTINENELNVLNDDIDVAFPTMDVHVTITSQDEKESSSIKLHEINHTSAKFFASVNEEYSIEFIFCKDKVTTQLPAEMSLNLINFFKLYKPKSNSNYCCINFAYEMAYGRGKISNDNTTENFAELSKSAFSEEKLVPGDIVHLFNASKTHHHYAVAIGQNKYLSLLGTSGPLSISTLDAVKKGFDADICAQVIKKSV